MNEHDALGAFQVTRREEMRARGLEQAALAESPWSGDYWPVYQGQIARRYADPHFPENPDWQKNSEYLLHELTREVSSSSIAQLSPAEKYDLLVGDAAQTLSHQMIQAGQADYTAHGYVESWMGLCHGWSPASIEVPRPATEITVLAADGRTRIPFRPDDIKGLVTALWANTGYPLQAAGQRCEVKNPKKDANGRIIDPDCFDTNPATWHKAVVNRLGVEKRSFVIDATYDYQVWNQPLSSYRYSYFNPESGDPAATLEAAKVNAGFARDKFAHYRSSKAVSVVGVIMDLTYIQEITASTATRNAVADDSHRTVRYMYDLELDANGEIIGGEWYMVAHPDFIWSPVPGSRPETELDRLLDESPGVAWDGAHAVPGKWSDAAPRASSTGQPLAHVVETLTALSKLAI